MGRFEEDKTADNNSALFHLKSGADCGLSIAEFTLGKSRVCKLGIQNCLNSKFVNELFAICKYQRKKIH